MGRGSPSIACFISPHGFGHAARACAVMAALYEQVPTLAFEIYSTVPEWFFAESLAAPTAVHPVLTDVGLVQRTALREDLNATAQRLRSFLPFDDGTLDGIAEELRRTRCRGVLCDVPAMGLAVARRAGVPSVLVENFTWDWIYSSYADSCPALEPVAQLLRREYATADLRLTTTPACQIEPGTHQVAPVSRKPRRPPAALRAELGVPDAMPMVLLTMGGIPWRYDSLRELSRRARAFFVVPGGADTARSSDSLLALAHHSPHYHPDLVHAADAVVGKLGYSTLAETFHAGCRFAFIPRSHFPESPALASFALAEMPAIQISEDEFLRDAWIDRLDELLALRRPTAPRPDGAAQAARLIAELLAL